MNKEMSQTIKVQKMIDDLTHGIDSQADKIIKELQGQKVKDAKMLLKTINFEMNPTKKKARRCVGRKVGFRYQRARITI